jgi:hypothetical protein
VCRGTSCGDCAGRESAEQIARFWYTRAIPSCLTLVASLKKVSLLPTRHLLVDSYFICCTICSTNSVLTKLNQPLCRSAVTVSHKKTGIIAAKPYVGICERCASLEQLIALLSALMMQATEGTWGVTQPSSEGFRTALPRLDERVGTHMATLGLSFPMFHRICLSALSFFEPFGPSGRCVPPCCSFSTASALSATV